MAKKKIRYALVGAGWIAQSAVLPAFKNAKKNSELVALVSDDPKKRKRLGSKLKVKTYSYDEYDACLTSGEIDAVYISLPNHLHRDYVVRAAEAGIHVLCEKPLAMNEDQASEMVDVCRRNGVRLMTAYRLHFDEANLRAIQLVKSGKIGEPRFYDSVFSMQAVEGNYRLKEDCGGGPLLDLGIYCINAARYLFREEPTEVIAFSATGSDKRFKEVEEMVSATLRFPGEKLATFTCSFGAASTAHFQVVGTKGNLVLDGAFDFENKMTEYLKVGSAEKKKKVYGKRDQFAPELMHFSDCVIKGKDPEPSGEEGLNDVRIMQAIYESIGKGTKVTISGLAEARHPDQRQQRKAPPVRALHLVNADEPAR